MKRFLGDTPLRVLVKLILLSLVVGLFLSTFALEPLELVQNFFSLLQRGLESLFSSLENFGGYILSGAVIVVPVWLLLRLLRLRR